MDKKEPSKHWMLPGDWVIRSATKPSEMYHFEEPVMAYMLDQRVEDEYTDHAVFVMDRTVTHMTIIDPFSGGKPEIIQLSLMNGEWHHATQKQVEVTWELAKGHVKPELMHYFDDVKKKYPYRPLGKGRAQ